MPGQTRLSQVRSGQVRPGHAKLSGFENTYTTFSILYRSYVPNFMSIGPTDPRVITVDTRIAPGHVIIFAIYTHTETNISKSFKVSAILFGTLHGDVLPMICAKYCCISRRQKHLKMHFATSTLKGQRSFRGKQ